MEFPPSLAFVLALGCAAAVPIPAGAAPLDGSAQAVIAPGLGCHSAPAMALLGQVADRHQQPRRKAPRLAETPAPVVPDAVPTLSHAFYTCAALPAAVLPAGPGWLAVGPIRRS